MSETMSLGEMGQDPVLRDAERVFEAMQQGGMAILPLDVAYAVVGTTAAAIRTIFATKRRSFEKPSGMFATWELSRDLHIIASEHQGIGQVIVEEYGLPFSIVAPYRADHPMLRGIDPFVLETSTKAGTLDMLINAGRYHDAVANMAIARGIGVFGSSANRSLTGSKFRFEDIEPEVKAAASIAIDGGAAKYANAEGKSSTIIDFRDFTLIRRGVCCDRLETIFRDRFGIVLREPTTAH